MSVASASRPSPSTVPAFLRRLVLTADEKHSVVQLGSAVTANPYADFEGFYASIRSARTQVPTTVAHVLREFRHQPRAGALLIQGVLSGVITHPTPHVPFATAPILDLGSEAPLVLLATMVAEPFSFKEWDAGHLVHNKYAIRSHREIQFGSNAVEFLLHTETPFRDFSPDFLALLCLRGDPAGRAMTRLCDLGRVIEDLPPDDLGILEGPFFAFETDNPFVTLDGKRLTRPLPIVSRKYGRRVFEYVHDLVAIDETSQRVLRRLKQRVEEATIDVELRAGDLLIIDNSHMGHGRSAYTPRYDGTDRWLQRALLTTRLFQDGDAPNGRLVADRQLEHYPTEYRNVLQSLSTAS